MMIMGPSSRAIFFLAAAPRVQCAIEMGFHKCNYESGRCCLNFFLPFVIFRRAATGKKKTRKTVDGAAFTPQKKRDPARMHFHTHHRSKKFAQVATPRAAKKVFYIIR